jgi:GTPase SAR1 family protein
MLFANKVDLDSAREVTLESLAEFASANHMEFLEGSAQTGDHVREAFEKIAEMLIDASSEPPRGVAAVSSDEPQGTCC